MLKFVQPRPRRCRRYSAGTPALQDELMDTWGALFWQQNSIMASSLTTEEDETQFYVATEMLREKN